MFVAVVGQGRGVGDTQGEGKDAQRNCLIQEKIERPLGSHGTSQLTQRTPAVYRRRVN